MASDIPSGVQVSSEPPPPPGAVPVYQVPAPGAEDLKTIEHIKVIGHSNLLYWWPLWAVCFLLAALTYMNGDQMAVVPAGTQVIDGVSVPGFDTPREVLVLPPNTTASLAPAQAEDNRGLASRVGRMTVSRNNSLGVLFAMTVLVVAVVSSLTLRGLVSIIALISVVVVVLALALLNLWDEVFAFFGGLDIRMNAAGYLFIAVPLFIVWLLVLTVYDRQSYVLFDEGQIRYVREVGESEIVVPAERSLVEKKRSDAFRHWLVGFGTGDLMIKTGNGQAIEMQNVLAINRKLKIIHHMLQHKKVS